MADDVWSRTAARFRKQRPRWRSPGALAAQLDPSWRVTPALQLIDDALVDVAEGRCKRLIVTLPPQEGKTSICAQAFPLWLLTFRPELRNAIASYEQDIAQRNGRRIRDWISTFDGTDGTLDLGLRVQRGDHSAARWSLQGHVGGVVCVGIGAALSGRPVDGVLVIDDPTKDHEQAMSSAHRAAVWNWWQSVARTRLSPDAAVVVIMTRWHAQDLVGMLLADRSEDWRVISVPAIADSPDDPLGRAEGEPLVSARGRSIEDWESTKRSVGSYVWASLYQGRPAPLGGGLFATDKIRYWSAGRSEAGEWLLDLAGRSVPMSLCHTFLVADLAASTRTSADYTVIGAFAITRERDLVLLDLVRDRMSPDKHFAAARPLFERWRAHTLYVEEMMSTVTLTYEAARGGIPISPLRADRDKVTRALPAAARMEQGRVWAPAGAPWLQDFIDELAAFPYAGAHDDMCDVLAWAAQIDATVYVPPLSDDDEHELRRRRYRRDEFEQALDGALGLPTEPVDFFQTSW